MDPVTANLLLTAPKFLHGVGEATAVDCEPMHVSPSLELLCAADEPGDRADVIGIDQDIVLDIQ